MWRREMSNFKSNCNLPKGVGAYPDIQLTHIWLRKNRTCVGLICRHLLHPWTMH